MLRNSLLLLATVFFAVGAPAPLVWAVDYLVIDNNGASGGDGSVGDEFGTITEALANAPLAAGDRIVLAAGNYTNAHETFPLVLPDGVSLVGAGSATTTIDAGGSAATGILVSGTGSLQTIEDLTLVADSSEAGILLGGTQYSFSMQNCVVSSGDTGIGFGTMFSDTMGSGNVRVSGCSFLGQTGDGIVTLAFGTGVQVFDIVSNFISGSSGALEGISVFGVALPGSSLDWEVNVTGNTVSGFMDTGILIGFGVQASGTLNADIEIRSNLATHTGGAGFNVAYFNGALNAIDVNASLICNTARNGTAGFILASGSAGLAFTGDFEVQSNLASSCGFGFAVTHLFGSGAWDLEYDISSNCFRNNGVGMFNGWLFAASGMGTLDVDVYRNVVTSNLSDGVRLAASTSSLNVAVNIDMGGGRELFGSNVFASNNQSSVGTGFDLDVVISHSTATWTARGNWWGTDSLVAIEALVRHQVDSAAFALVDFSSPFADPMTLTPVGVATVGGLLTINNNDAAFVPVAGKKLLQATFDGNPINVTVAGNGASLNFIVPVVVPGAYILVVTNPGGQSGSVSIGIVGSSGDGDGGCFIATAAHGDEDAPEVMLLRQWRDQHLSTNTFGRQLVQAYYAVSPPLAGAIAERPWARSVSRAALAPVVGAARLWMEAPWALGGLGIAAGWLLLRRRRS